MAIARLSTGELYGTYEDINKIVGPTAVGSFKLPPDIRKKMAELSMPVDENGAEYFFSNFDPDAQKFADDEGFITQQVRCFVPPKVKEGMAGFSTNPGGAFGEMPAADLKAYETPHRVQANELHYLFSGCIAKGFQLDDGRQAMVYVTGGEWMRIYGVSLNWPVFNSGAASAAMSFYDREPQKEGGQFEMEMHPEFKPLDTMRF